MNGLDDVTRDFVGLFETENIPYALMGGLAVRIHALPRATYDVDFTALVPRSELPRLYRLVPCRKKRAACEGFPAVFSPEDTNRPCQFDELAVPRRLLSASKRAHLFACRSHTHWHNTAIRAETADPARQENSSGGA